MVSPSSPEGRAALDVFREGRRIKHCDARELVENSIPDLVTHETFPLANNQYPASDFVTGIIKLREIDLNFGPLPPEYTDIWRVLTGDGDKSFNASERDEVVRLWKGAGSEFSFDCPRPER